MSGHVPDLAAYFARIGYTGPRAATLATLTAIHQHHVRAIPFENLDVLLGRGISLELAAIEQKLVQQKRGGYCFEQNGLLRDVLRALGFRVTPLIARVRWQVPAEVATPCTHMVLRVEVDGRGFLADAGFGSGSLFAPLALEFDREQDGSLEPRRLVRRGALAVQQTLADGVWADLYQFAIEEAPQIDFELGNWFTSTHPQSRFRQNLTVARAAHDRRVTLFNREFAMRFADGGAEKQTLSSPDELLAVLATHFDLHFPAGTRFGPPGAPWPS